VISDVLAQCTTCGEQHHRYDVRDDERGTFWLIACSPTCPPNWRLVVASVKSCTDDEQGSLSPTGLRRAILRTQREVLANRSRLERVEKQIGLA
jgi:hypothetical protein